MSTYLVIAFEQNLGMVSLIFSPTSISAEVLELRISKKIENKVFFLNVKKLYVSIHWGC